MRPSWSANGWAMPEPASANAWPIVAVPIEPENDVVTVRQRAHRIAELLSFDRQDQTRIATAVSEIARNAFEYAGGGMVEMAVSKSAPHTFFISVRDKGPGITDLDRILSGEYVSKTGVGLGIV